MPQAPQALTLFGYFPGPPTRPGECLEGSCGYSITIPSGRGVLSDFQLDKIDQTHVEDVQDAVEVLLPTYACIFIVLSVEEPRDRVSFAPRHDLPLDYGYSPTIGTLVSEPFKVVMASSTHAVSFSIASSTERLSSFNRFPFNPRSSVLHISPQETPSST